MVKFVPIIIIHNNFAIIVSRVHDRPPKKKVNYNDKQQTLDLSLQLKSSPPPETAGSSTSGASVVSTLGKHVIH